MAELSEELRALEAAQRENSRLLEDARRPAREEYARLAARHQLRLGFYQLAVLVPLLTVLVGMILKRRTAKRLLPSTDAAQSAEEPYVCPVCATSLFEECPACHGVRASLLPACNRCGAATANADTRR